MSEFSNKNTEESILQVLSYSHIFQHPLTKAEIFSRLSQSTIPDEFDQSLNNLIDSNIISQMGDYYSLISEYTLVERRLVEEQLAEKYLKIARLTSKIIYLIPFVRGVFISGSLSKGRVHENGDIDFFIVTKKRRMWVCRMIVIFFKKVFLLNSFKYFCVNYFVDEENLEVIDKNMFTAMEVATLLPIRGSENLYKEYKKHNTWIKEFNLSFRLNPVWKNKSSFIKKSSQFILEPLLSLLPLESLDRRFMRITYKRWSRLFKETWDKDDFETAFKTYRGVSKNHRGNYQRIVDEKFKQIYEPVIERYKSEKVL